MLKNRDMACNESVSENWELLVKGFVNLTELLVSLLSDSILGNHLQGHLILLLKNQLVLSLNVLCLSLGQLLERHDFSRACTQLLFKLCLTLCHCVDPL